MVPTFKNYPYCDRTRRRKIRALIKNDLQQIQDQECSSSGTRELQSSNTVSVAGVEELSINMDNCTDNNELSSQPDSLPMQEKELQPRLTSYVSTASHFNDNDDHDSNGSDVEASAYSPPMTDNTSGSDDSEACSDYPVRRLLAEWATKFNISHVALSDLLPILRRADVDVPLDPRTLLTTPKNSVVLNKAGGTYHYFGIVTTICQQMKRASDYQVHNIDTLTLHINIDGLQLFSSSSVALWPVLGMIKEFKSSPFAIAVYSGKGKPTSVDDYLQDFISEMKLVLETGFTFNGKSYKLVLGAVICDAPARAFVKCIKGHAGYNACERCIQVGVYLDGRMTFPELDARERTDAEFLDQSALSEDHRTGVSPFVHLGIGCVGSFPLDYMHLVCLGVVRRMIMLWLKGPLKCRISASQTAMISEKLIACRSHMPREFGRKPRSLHEVSQWKATEFRQFLLYSGLVVLIDILPEQFYANFKMLFVSMTILLSPSMCANSENCKYVEELLKVFVTNFSSLYGKSSIVYNVHSLIHLPQDARKYGALDNISSFPYETFLGKLKRSVRRPHNPVAQVVRRVHEIQQSWILKKTESKSNLKKQHSSGPLPRHMDICISSQFKAYFHNGMFISSTLGNNCFEVNGKVVLVRNICVSEHGDVIVICEPYKEVSSFFQYPLDSKDLGIYRVSDLSGHLKAVNVCEIGRKYVLLPSASSFVAIPLLHTTEPVTC